MANCIEWNTIDMACSLYGIVLVPFYDNLTEDSITYILKQTGQTTVFCTERQAQALLDTTDIGSLKNIVMVGKLNTDDRQRAKTRGLQIIEYRNILEEGQKNARELPKNIKPHDVFTFSYTSGSTGIPKGVMLKHVSFLSPISAMKELQLKSNDRMLCYMPLPHGTSRFCNMLAQYYGARIGLSCGDITKLNEDLKRLKPTLFITVPTLFNKYYEVINDQFSKITGCKASLIKHAIKTKLDNLKNKNEFTHSIYDPLIFNKIKNLFGGCVKHCLCASAPISKEVLDFFKISLGVCVLEAFGLTEAGGMQFCTHQEDINASGMVGGARANIEVKLVDIKDMGFLSTDTSDDGYLQPRGEICTRGPGLFAGYYKDEEKTEEILDKEGWLHSGDIGILYPNGSLRVVGRIANVFQLNNGKFISLERIENALVRVQGVSEVFITSNGSHDYVVAILVPKKEVVLKILSSQSQKKIVHIKNNIKASQNTISTQETRINIDEEIIIDYEEVCRDCSVVEYFKSQFEELQKSEQLVTSEFIKKIVIETQSLFSLRLYTQSFKLQRFFARKHFLVQLEKI